VALEVDKAEEDSGVIRPSRRQACAAPAGRVAPAAFPSLRQPRKPRAPPAPRRQPQAPRIPMVRSRICGCASHETPACGFSTRSVLS